ncbi:MAG TPA: hypothetical protein VNV44_05665 [Solirubrobacteraceae bacterium]|nr:hypothetical protein [Solirubrobacteraceae bacterium]
MKSITVEATEVRDLDELRKLRDELPNGSVRRSRIEDQIFEQHTPATRPF